MGLFGKKVEDNNAGQLEALPEPAKPVPAPKPKFKYFVVKEVEELTCDHVKYLASQDEYGDQRYPCLMCPTCRQFVVIYGMNQGYEED